MLVGCCDTDRGSQRRRGTVGTAGHPVPGPRLGDRLVSIPYGNLCADFRTPFVPLEYRLTRCAYGCPITQAVWDWLPEPSAAELEAMTAAAAAQSRGSIAPICSRIVATIIPGAKHMQSEDALRGTTEFSPSKRRRADSVNRHARRNSPWNSEGEWVDETADEEEQSVDHFCCGLARVKNVKTINAVRIRLPRSGRLIVGSAAFMAGLDAALLWASLPLAVISIADVSLPSVGVIVCLISAAHSLGQLLGAALIWHGRFRPLSRLKPLSMLLLGQIGLIVSFTALAIARSLLWIGCARLVSSDMFCQDTST